MPTQLRSPRQLNKLKMDQLLTEREMAVCRCLRDAKTNEEIAREMEVTVNTVKTHLKNVYRKLGVSQRMQAVAMLNRKRAF